MHFDSKADLVAAAHAEVVEPLLERTYAAAREQTGFLAGVVAWLKVGGEVLADELEQTGHSWEAVSDAAQAMVIGLINLAEHSDVQRSQAARGSGQHSCPLDRAHSPASSMRAAWE